MANDWMSNNNNDWIVKQMQNKGKEKSDSNENTGLINSPINDLKNNEIMINRGNGEISNTNNNREINNIPNMNIQNVGNVNDKSYDAINGCYKDKFTIKQEISQKLNEQMKNNKNPSENFLRTMISQLLNEYNITDFIKNQIVQEMIWDLNGYGIIQPLLDDESITEIICCSYNNIWIEKDGKMQKTDYKFANEKELRNIIDKIVQPLGRRIDDSQPYVNARLADQSRVNIVINPICADGATLDIRKFARQVFTMQDYIDKESMTKEMAELIKWITITRKNVIVSGGTGSGKTTLLNCISRFIPDTEAIITVEDLLELQLIQPCLRRLEARGGNAEGKGAITIRDLVTNALRMRPDRLIVGECRSSEVVDMLQAMNTGHDGSLTTVHSNNAKECIERLTTMYLFGGLDIPEIAIKSQISSAIHVIIQAKRLDNGLRKIIQISEVLGLGKRGVEKNNEHVKKYNLDPKFLIKSADSKEVYIQDIFRYDEDRKVFVRTGWIPTFYKQMKTKGCPLEVEDFSPQNVE